MPPEATLAQQEIPEDDVRKCYRLFREHCAEMLKMGATSVMDGQLSATFHDSAAKLAVMPTIIAGYQETASPYIPGLDSLATLRNREHEPTPRKPTDDELREAEEAEYVPGAT